MLRINIRLLPNNIDRYKHSQPIHRHRTIIISIRTHPRIVRKRHRLLHRLHQVPPSSNTNRTNNITTCNDITIAKARQLHRPIQNRTIRHQRKNSRRSYRRNTMRQQPSNHFTITLPNISTTILTQRRNISPTQRNRR